VLVVKSTRHKQFIALACAAAAVVLMGWPSVVGAQDDTVPAVSETPPAQSQQDQNQQDPVPPAEVMLAILQGLDKTTARVSTVEAPIGGVARFGTLEIVARDCQKKPPTEPPESAAFLEITDVRPDSPAVRVFSGWMFASSPALSVLEHPVYDVWVIDCRMGPPPPETSPSGEMASPSGEATDPSGEAGPLQAPE
jgi:hypothetical protein